MNCPICKHLMIFSWYELKNMKVRYFTSCNNIECNFEITKQYNFNGNSIKFYDLIEKKCITKEINVL